MPPTALAALLTAHRALGAEAHALAATATDGRRVPRRRVRALVRALTAHQHAEEVAVFPALARAAPGFDAAALVADHGELADAARDLRAAGRRGPAGDPAAAVVRLDGLVRMHLADEQRVVVPRWAPLSPAEDDAVGAAVHRAVGPVGRIRLARLVRRHHRAGGLSPGRRGRRGCGRRGAERGRTRGGPRRRAGATRR